MERNVARMSKRTPGSRRLCLNQNAPRRARITHYFVPMKICLCGGSESGLPKSGNWVRAPTFKNFKRPILRFQSGPVLRLWCRNLLYNPTPSDGFPHPNDSSPPIVQSNPILRTLSNFAPHKLLDKIC